MSGELGKSTRAGYGKSYPAQRNADAGADGQLLDLHLGDVCFHLVESLGKLGNPSPPLLTLSLLEPILDDSLVMSEFWTISMNAKHNYQHQQ